MTVLVRSSVFLFHNEEDIQWRQYTLRRPFPINQNPNLPSSLPLSQILFILIPIDARALDHHLEAWANDNAVAPSRC